MPADDHGHPLPFPRRDLLVAGAAAAGANVVAGLAGAGHAGADAAFDVQLLQTSASIENLLVGTYDSILALPVMGSPTFSGLRNLLSTSRTHHSDHARACNNAAAKLGGGPQTGPNPGLASAARSRQGDIGQILDLAYELETASSQTYQNSVGLLGDLDARKLSASILAVEAQHASVLLVHRALLGVNMPDLMNLEIGALAKFPPDAARAGTPDSFTKVDQARPPAEGAVR